MTPKDWFDEEDYSLDIFDDTDELIEYNECICDECQGTFILVADSSIFHCPLCGCSFDKD